MQNAKCPCQNVAHTMQMTGSSSKLLQIQGKWYQDRKPTKIQNLRQKKKQRLRYTIGSQILRCFVGIESQKSGDGTGNSLSLNPEVPASLSAKSPGSDPVVFVNRSMKLICMICSWRCFFGCKEGRCFFTPRVSHSDQHDQHKNKNMPFLDLNTIEILMYIPTGSARGQSPREAQRLQAVAMTSYLVREPRAAGTVPKVVLVVRPC